MNKKQLMAGTLAALTVASATMPAALAAQPDTAVPYAVMSTKSLEGCGPHPAFSRGGYDCTAG